MHKGIGLAEKRVQNIQDSGRQRDACEEFGWVSSDSGVPKDLNQNNDSL